MTKNERIEKLEKEVEEMKVIIAILQSAVLEYRPSPLAPVYPAYPPIITFSGVGPASKAP